MSTELRVMVTGLSTRYLRPHSIHHRERAGQMRLWDLSLRLLPFSYDGQSLTIFTGRRRPDAIEQNSERIARSLLRGLASGLPTNKNSLLSKIPRSLLRGSLQSRLWTLHHWALVGSVFSQRLKGYARYHWLSMSILIPGHLTSWWASGISILFRLSPLKADRRTDRATRPEPG